MKTVRDRLKNQFGFSNVNQIPTLAEFGRQFRHLQGMVSMIQSIALKE